VRRGLLVAAGFFEALGLAAVPNTPIILEPSADGQIVNYFDVHMVTAPFAPATSGETHLCSDWRIETLGTRELVWEAPCATGVSSVHIHLGDGVFSGPLAKARQLTPDEDYLLRVRFQVSPASGGTETSDWAERAFHTSQASQIQPLLVSDAARLPEPSWIDEDARPVSLSLPSDGSIVLHLEAAGVGAVLELMGSAGGSTRVVNPEELPSHAPARVVIESRSAEAVLLLPSRLQFTDGGGADRTIYLPQLDLPPAGSLSYWVAENGGTFVESPTNPAPDFGTLARQAPVPWSVRQPGFAVVPVATGFRLPVNIAFVPRPGPGSLDPLFYVTELYGDVKVVTRSGEVRDYATGLLNFDPVASFPGSGERGLTGIVVEPETGDLFVGLVYAEPVGSETHYPAVIRLHGSDGGLAASSRTTVLEMPNDPVGPSHQISNLSIGPDGKLFVHVGDGFDVAVSQHLGFFRGKILRLDLDGSAPPDNPFFNAADGIGAADYVFVYGLRNPFGGAWRLTDGLHYFVENGPFVDRLSRAVAGTNYLWDGSDLSMYNYALYNWTAANSPVNIAFVEPQTFGGSRFPSDKMGHAYVTESGPTYAFGPQANGKRISEFAFDALGNLTAGPLPLIEYNGAGRASAVGLAAGPDGLYFSDLYKDVGAEFPYDRGSSIFRVSWVGIVGFSAENAAGPAPLAVRFHNLSNVPDPVAWRWEFGDGSTSAERNPVHTYAEPGTYDVRLTVTGSGGEVAHQKNRFAVVDPGTDGLPPPLFEPCSRRPEVGGPEGVFAELPCFRDRRPRVP
jgi:hypothetical protein